MCTPLVWGGATVAVGGSLALDQPLGLLLAGGVVLATWVASKHPALQARLDRARTRETVRRGREVRETRLEDSGVSREPLATLTDLVDPIAVAGLAPLAELETLLDQFAELAIERVRLALVAGTTRDPGAGGPARALRSTAARLRAVRLEQTRVRLARIDGELLAIEEMLHGLAHRAASSTG